MMTMDSEDGNFNYIEIPENTISQKIKQRLRADATTIPEHAEVKKLMSLHKLRRIYSLAIEGRIYALTCLAKLYAEGKGLPKDLEFAIQIFEEVVDGPNVPEDIKFVYANTLEEVADYDKAYIIYSSLCESGFGLAFVRRAFMYKEGRGVLKSDKTFQLLLHKGALTGSLRARSAYAHYLLRSGNLLERIRALGMLLRNVRPASKLVLAEKSDGNLQNFKR